MNNLPQENEMGQPLSCPFLCCPLTGVQANRGWGLEVSGALVEGRIKLYRQPIVTRGGVRRFEVLARLEKGGEVLSPAVWMPALEGDGDLARTFDLWVLEGALRRLSREVAADAAGRPSQVWVNFFGHSVRRGFAGQVEQLLGKYELEPGRLCVEVTESVAAGEGYRREIRDLVGLGCDVAIDDVGAGFSNVGSLVELPVTWFKIDGALLASPRRMLAAKHLIWLARELRLGVVAEWVETSHQALLLWRWGVNGMQGFDVPRAGAGKPRPWD